MRYLTRAVSTALFIGVAFVGAHAQSLSIVKDGKTNSTVKASAPSSTPYVLQASANLHLWADVHDPVQGQYLYLFNTTDVLRRYFRLIPSPGSPPPISLMMIGDSMTSDCCGWGQSIPGYVKPEVRVINYAQAWVSTKVFLRSPDLDKMLVVQPEYVFIQFGYMDDSGGSPDKIPDSYTTLEEFGQNLRTLVDTVRSFNGVPILITVHSARQWDATGKVIPSWIDRNNVTKQVAKDLNVYLIDLNQLSMDLLNKLGPSCESWMHLPGFVDADIMHMSSLGAKYISQLVVNALPDALGPYLTGIFDAPPKP